MLGSLEQVTRGHNIVADGCTGASNPQSHPIPATHLHTHTHNNSVMNARFRIFNPSVTDQGTDGRTDGQTDGQMDKASYRVACPQLKSVIDLVKKKGG